MKNNNITNQNRAGIARLVLRLVCVVVCTVGLCPAAEAADDTQNQSLARWHAKADPYLAKVRQQRDWLSSRLQMYWYSHATDVYVDGESFDHAGGRRAPVATLRLNGARGLGGSYNRPKLADVVPYDDDANGNVTFVGADGKMAKTHPSKTGTSINSINQEILGIAEAASDIYRATGDTAYAHMAADVFDTYLKGIYYRNVPIDMNQGHIQTLVGMTTFEVIHEDGITNVTHIYDNLRDYLDRADFPLYDAALKKWAEVEIAHGVPHNNWNLIQARFIFDIAQVLQSDSTYADHRGRQYYTNHVLHRSGIRQWSLDSLCRFGFDPKTAIWYESPGYSVGVLADLGIFANDIDRQAGIDVFRQLPVIGRALRTSPQYLMPNRMIVGFGDTHPDLLNQKGIRSMRAYALRHHDTALQAGLDSLSAAVQPDAPESLIGRYVSPSFYAPNVSWLMQRSGMDRAHDLAISLNGSLGNHQHANGISMELYGKGYVLAPDGGIGKYLYSGADYAEYYSQFPAHNTVCVDGISSYPVMMSNHSFKLRHRFPSDNSIGQFVPVTYSEVEFIEPESMARQVRTNALVKTSGTGGYYVDIFRSRKIDGGDKMHDYFYHNLGQVMTLTEADGDSLTWQPTDQLAFAGGHLYAYSYIYNKVYTETPGDVCATFRTTLKDGSSIDMNMWMRGDSRRKLVKALSPVNMEYERMKDQPYDLDRQPVLTFIARQYGEAWTHPFVAIYEPTTTAEPGEIRRVSYFTPRSRDASAVGIRVERRNGDTDYIFSSVTGDEMRYKGMTVKGGFGIISTHFSLLNGKYTKK